MRKQTDMEIRIPAPAEEIINKLNEYGYEAYVVGGCVRDMLLGREPGDWDITTSALPEQVKEVFRRTVDTGIQHGTVTVMMGKEGYEVTTYRIDGEYSDGRHPNSVEFTPDLVEDLKRRDFTINAMAYNSHTGERAHAAFPDGVIDDVNYDGSIRAFLFLLNNDCCTSIDKSRAFLSDLTGGKLNISKGMISRLNRSLL
jgi:hypothetical protein